MSIFRRRRTEQLGEINLDESFKDNNRSDVLDTIESLEIPRERLIIVGSGVLSLLGLKRQAHDLDAILHPEELDRLHTSGKLPGGIPVEEATFSRPERRHFQADTQPLPSELFSHRTALSPETFESFVGSEAVPIRQVDSLVDPSGVPEDLLIIRPSILLAHKMQRIHVGTPRERALKAAQDAYDRDIIIGR